MSGRRQVIVCGLLALAACDTRGWQARAIDAAEDEIRAEVDDPAAQFSEVQITGDDKTGQTCGKVKAAGQHVVRFIVYIDGTSGPFLGGGQGHHPIFEDHFESAWYSDCLREGWRPSQ